jgi:hypothetical protein
MEALWATILFSGFALEVIIRQREKVSDAFRQRVIDLDLLKRMTLDIPRILGKNE